MVVGSCNCSHASVYVEALDRVNLYVCVHRWGCMVVLPQLVKVVSSAVVYRV